MHGDLWVSSTHRLHIDKHRWFGTMIHQVWSWLVSVAFLEVVGFTTASKCTQWVHGHDLCWVDCPTFWQRISMCDLFSLHNSSQIMFSLEVYNSSESRVWWCDGFAFFVLVIMFLDLFHLLLFNLPLIEVSCSFSCGQVFDQSVWDCVWRGIPTFIDWLQLLDHCILTYTVTKSASPINNISCLEPLVSLNVVYKYDDVCVTFILRSRTIDRITISDE